MNIMYIVKVVIIFLLKWSFRSPRPYLNYVILYPIVIDNNFSTSRPSSSKYMWLLLGPHETIYQVTPIQVSDQDKQLN